jgi:hypothetical protein
MLMPFLGRLGFQVSRLALLGVVGLAACGAAQAQLFNVPDNEARLAINRAHQRIDALLIDFNRLRGDAQVFRTEGEAIRREADILRRDVNAVQTNLDLMLRKIDAKIDDGIKPV